MKKQIRAIAAVIVFGVVMPTNAQSVVGGTINNLDTAPSAGSYDMRVVLRGFPSLCSGAADPQFAYVNSNDANYSGVAALLMTAMALNKTISLTTTLTGSYCKIAYVKVYN